MQSIGKQYDRRAKANQENLDEDKQADRNWNFRPIPNQGTW